MKRIALVIGALLLAAAHAIAGPFAASAAGNANAAGSSCQVQANSGANFIGMSGTCWDDTNRSLVITGATVTASKPAFDLTQTWNNSGVTFTGLRLNVTSTASASASLLMDLQVGGVSQWSVDKSGNVVATNNVTIKGGAAFLVNGNFALAQAGSGLGLYVSGYRAYIAANMLRLENTSVVGWASDGNPHATAADIGFARKAAGLAEVNNGTAATYTGTALVLGPQTVAQLTAAVTCNATNKGARATVTDATSTTFLASLAGSGSNVVPTFCNGTSWLIG